LNDVPEDLMRQHMIETLRAAARNGSRTPSGDEKEKGEAAARMRRALVDEVTNFSQNRDYFARDRLLVRCGLDLLAMLLAYSGTGGRGDLHTIAAEAADSAVDTWQRRTRSGPLGRRAEDLAAACTTAGPGPISPDNAVDRWRIRVADSFLAAIVSAAGWSPSTAHAVPEVRRRLSEVIQDEIGRMGEATPNEFIARLSARKVLQAIYYLKGCQDPTQLLAKAEELLAAALDDRKAK
jgi:hypothetical protein